MHEIGRNLAHPWNRKSCGCMWYSKSFSGDSPASQWGQGTTEMPILSISSPTHPLSSPNCFIVWVTLAPPPLQFPSGVYGHQTGGWEGAEPHQRQQAPGHQRQLCTGEHHVRPLVQLRREFYRVCMLVTLSLYSDDPVNKNYLNFLKEGITANQES